MYLLAKSFWIEHVMTGNWNAQSFFFFFFYGVHVSCLRFSVVQRTQQEAIEKFGESPCRQLSSEQVSPLEDSYPIPVLVIPVLVRYVTLHCSKLFTRTNRVYLSSDARTGLET